MEKNCPVLLRTGINVVENICEAEVRENKKQYEEAGMARWNCYFGITVFGI